MPKKAKCSCSSHATLIFACSGASDVGEITDRAARRLARNGVGKMYCLAGIGGRVNSIVKTTEQAEKILAIDGCTLACARQSLKRAGIRNFTHLQLADIGMGKGDSPATPNRIAKVVSAGLAVLSQQGPQT